MKKTLVVLLALVMVFAFATTAMAADTQYTPYGDIATQDADTQTAIERLSILGALKGYNAEGTVYAPANLISREEFATIGVRIAGLEDQVPLYASLASAFKDVEEGRWSEGYINCANANGIMIGRGAGVFDPKANVTMQEVVTVLLRAVGYTDQLPGSWPTDYNNKAVSVGLTEYVDFIGPKYATRGEVAALTNEAVDLYCVAYVDNEIAQGLGQTIGFMTNMLVNVGDYIGGNGPVDILDIVMSMINYVDADGFAYRTFNTNDQKKAGSTLLTQSFDAYVLSERVFWDDVGYMSEATAWGVVDFEDWELEAYFGRGYYDSNDGLYVDGDDPFEFASLYGISGGQDLTDLGWQVADITFNDDDEIVYITTLSTITRTADADKAYDKTSFGDDLLKEAYGEVWYYDWSGKGAKDITNYYAAKDFSYFEYWWFDIVAGVDADGWECHWNYSYDFDDDYVYYLVGTGFIDGADLEVNDVVYWDELAGDADYFLALVFRPVAGTLDDYGTDFIEVDDEEYGAISSTPDDFYNSFYSIDKGKNIDPYTDDTVFAVDFSDSIYWAPAYAFINFSYFYDDMQMYYYGVLDSYVYGNTYVKDYLFESNNTQAVSAINVLLPGDTKLTTIEFKTKINEADFDGLPREGSLIEFTLNKDGKIIGDFVDGHDWYRGDFGPLYLDCYGTHGDVLESAWTNKGRLTLFGPAFDATYSFADDAVIFLVESNEKNSRYAFDSVECLDYDDFKALGDFSGYVCLYKTKGKEISVMYVKDLEKDASEAYGFGLYLGKGAKSVSLDSYYLEIGGKAILVDGDVYDDLGGKKGLVAYKTTDGEIEDGNWLLFNDEEVNTKAAITAYYNAANDWYDELDLEIDLAIFGDHIKATKDAKFSGLYHGTGPISLFYGDLIDSYDYAEKAAVDFNDSQYGKYSVIVYDADDDMFYLLVGPSSLFG